MIAGSAKKVARNYPNGTLTTGAGSVATAIIWFTTNVLHLPMDAAAGAAFATVFAGAASFIGRKGLKGCLGAIWKGAATEEE